MILNIALGILTAYGLFVAGILALAVLGALLGALSGAFRAPSRPIPHPKLARLKPDTRSDWDRWFDGQRGKDARMEYPKC